ncbi:MAG: glycosyltransferase, partial [Candidatus Eisenbacteria sp.]|nr:glycosyltransferase [Candidatus Eisenbacteria bacterium]
MKIAMLGQKGIPATYGGIERHVEELGTRLVERGHEVTVYCRPYYTKMQGEYRGIRIANIPSVRTKHLDTATHCALALPHIISQNYDIVHFHAL